MFTPKQNSQSVSVPYFEDARASDGWQGQSTTKTLDKLQDEIRAALGRMGGAVSGFQRGTFHANNQTREGYQIHYAIKAEKGWAGGRLDIAALPIRVKRGNARAVQARQDAALKMALYMACRAIEGMWFLQQLSPGYAPLMPWMLNEKGETVSELWARSAVMSNLLPPPDAEFVEGEIVD